MQFESKEFEGGDCSTIVSKQPIHVGIVVGEVSGDILGAGLVRSIKQRYPNAVFEGIGGPLMQAEGFRSMFPMERLSVMGLFEVLGRIFELIAIRRQLRTYFTDKKPDIFIGIDAPDFNLGLELQLREQGVKTAHYVSPSVWAWRQKRVFKIARAVDLMLTLLPFEAKFYKAHEVAVKFVGHPLADDIPLKVDRDEARSALGLTSDQEVLAILPGSRGGEISRIGASFLNAAELISKAKSGVVFVIPCVNEARRAQVQSLLDELDLDLDVRLILGRSREVMASSNVVLLASGTATLECMLLKRPMVVAYKLNRLTYRIMKRLLKTPYVALPNLLANKGLVPELIQDAATPEAIAQSVLERFPPEVATSLEQEFSRLHLELRKDASNEAANAVSELIGVGIERQ